MSTESASPGVPCRSLADYIRELVDRLAAADPDAFARMRAIVGTYRARIALDDEAVDVRFAPSGLVTDPASDFASVDGTGRCDRATVLDLLDGYLEVNEALRTDRIQVIGRFDAVQRMFIAIEILLDASARVPALRALAEDYRRDPCLPAVTDLFPKPRVRRGTTASGAAETDLLTRLDLMP